MNARHALMPIALVLLSACQPSAGPPPVASEAVTPAVTAAAPVTPAPAQVIADYMAAWNAHDAERAASFFADDGVYLDASVGTPQTGRQAALDNVIRVFLTAVPDAVWELRGEPIASADGIAFEWRFHGTNSGDWSAETKATGNPLDFSGVSFVRLRNGQIAYQGDYYDAATLNKQMGW